MKTNEIVGKFFRDVEKMVKGDLREDYERILASGNFPMLKHFLDEHNLIHFMRDTKGNTVLHLMAAHQVPKNLHPLINEGLDVNAVNDQGETPLHSACQTRCLSNIKLLINCGADTQVIDHTGNTILHIAAQYGHLAVIDFLVQEGIDAKQENKRGQSFIDVAVANEHYEVASRYLEQTA